MSKLPNIIEKEKGLFATIFWSLGFAYRTDKRSFVGVFIFTVLNAAISFANIFSFSQIVNLLSQGIVDFKKIIPYLFILLVVNYIPPILSFIRHYFVTKLQRVTFDSITEFINIKTTDLDIGTIEQPEFQNLLSKARRGASSALSLVDFSFNLLRDVTSFIIAAVIIIYTLPIGFLIISVTLIPIYFFERYEGKKVFAIWNSLVSVHRTIGNKTRIFDSKIALVEMKIAGIRDFFLSKIRILQQEVGGTVEDHRLRRIPVFAAANLISNIGMIIVAGLVVYQVIIGIRLLGSLVLIWTTISRFSLSAESIFRASGRIVEHQAHALKLFSLLELTSYIDDNEKGELLSRDHNPTIELKNVSFSYPGTDKIILSNISLVINPNEEIAIVGLNGAGKTTLFRLLTRVYDPTEGEILIDGKPLASYNLKSWHQILSLMSQDYTIFSEETIEENILFNQQKKKELLDQSVSESGVSEYVSSFSKGMDQMIGREFDGGIELSKGQQQKLALARTLYPNTPVVILDEPTSAIDAVSEDSIFKALRNNHKDQTRIIISHKFSNVRDADKIILIEHGTIIEQGSHDQLMKKKKGKYKELFELQAEGYK